MLEGRGCPVKGGVRRHEDVSWSDIVGGGNGDVYLRRGELGTGSISETCGRRKRGQGQQAECSDDPGHLGVSNIDEMGVLANVPSLDFLWLL